MDKEQADRIENGIRFLVKRVGFPYRNAWDGLPRDEQAERSRQEEINIDNMVDRIMQTGDPYPRT